MQHIRARKGWERNLVYQGRFGNGDKNTEGLAVELSMMADLIMRGAADLVTEGLVESWRGGSGFGDGEGA